MSGSWSPRGSQVRYARGTLALREDVWRLPGGAERVYPVLVVGVTVGVLPLVAPDRVLLVRQYRHLQRALSWELPGGGARPGETPAAAALRELREEGGYHAESLEPITHFYPSNAYLDEVAHCFVARGLRPDPLPADDDEFLERAILPLADVVRMALQGEITESVSKVTVLQYALAAAR